MLEDDHGDVIGKAMTGRGLSVEELIRELGLSREAWEAFLQGRFDAALARACAERLGLRADALAALPEYRPAAVALDGLRQLSLPFGPYRVNAWWIEVDGCRLIFDAGLSAQDLSAALPGRPGFAFITHDHPDHVGGLGLLRDQGVEVRAAGVAGTLPMAVGEVWRQHSLKVRAIDLSGHAVPALGFLIEGLARPLVVVGDALFAGSMGKCPSVGRFNLALQTLHAAVDTLPDETVLLPGHGPATSLGEERASNPFL